MAEDNPRNMNSRKFLPLLLGLTSLFIIYTNLTGMASLTTSSLSAILPSSDQWESLEAALNHNQAVEHALKTALDNVQLLRAQLDEAQLQLTACRQEQKSGEGIIEEREMEEFEVVDKDETAIVGDINNNNTLGGSSLSGLFPSFGGERSGYCSFFPHPVPSALSIWNSNLFSIHQASKHELDKRYTLHDFTAGLLHLVSPDRLARSTMALPHDWNAVRRILQKLYNRYIYLTRKQTEAHSKRRRTKPPVPEPPRLKILVMGGSLIVGVNCRKIVTEHQLGMQMPNRLCTWTHRLETLLNNLLGGDYVEVQKIALGGTNTQTGFVMWDSNFLPEESMNPDILMNAYSTNDMHILTVLQAKEGNQTLRDKVMEMTQDFVRSVLKDGPCGAPLYVHMDDYLGNEQREILVTTELSQAVAVLANYYGISSVSYANVVRDLVYADTQESWISPQGWYEKGEMVREIHPGMGMHIISSWVAAYNFLNLATTYCTIEPFLKLQAKPLSIPGVERRYEPIHGLPKFQQRPVIPGKPKGRPLGLPPKLEPSLSLENITALWKAAKPVAGGTICRTTGSLSSSSSQFNSTTQQRCPFSWFSGLSKQGLNATYAHELFAVNHNPYVVENTGWDIDTGGNKLGISPSSAQNSYLKMKFTDMSLSTVTFFYMKSYGPKWTNSKMEFIVTMNGKEVIHDILKGVHEKETSETYTHRVDLPQRQHTDSDNTVEYDVAIRHLSGETFKIMGLAICK